MAHPIVLGYDGSACSSRRSTRPSSWVATQRAPASSSCICHEPPPGLSCALDRGCAAAKELRDYERRVESEVEPMLRRAADRVRDRGHRNGGRAGLGRPGAGT